MSNKERTWRHNSSLDTPNIWPRKISEQVVFTLKLWANSAKKEPPCNNFCRAGTWSLMNFYHHGLLRVSAYTDGLIPRKQQGSHRGLAALIFWNLFPKTTHELSISQRQFWPNKRSMGRGGRAQKKIRICECSPLQDRTYNIKDRRNFRSQDSRAMKTSKWQCSATLPVLVS